MEIKEKAQGFIEAFGGAENIVDMEGCITRLRGTLKDTTKMSLKQLQKLGMIGRPIMMGKGVQVVVGTHAELIGSAMNEILQGKA